MYFFPAACWTPSLSCSVQLLVFITQRSSLVELRKVWPISQCWWRVSSHFRLVTPSTVVSSNLSLPTVLLCWTSTTSRFLNVSLASSSYWHEILSGGIRNRFGAASQAVIKRANVHLHDVVNYSKFQTQVTPAHAVKSVTVHFRLCISCTYTIPVAVEPGRMALRYDVHAGSGVHSASHPMCYWK